MATDVETEIPSLSAACIDEQAALDVASGRLPAGDAERVRAHIAQCPACFDLVAAALTDRPVDAVASTATAQAGPAAARLAPGTVVAGYRIQAMIGEGSAGCVYRAEHVGSATSVAVKAYKPQATDPQARRTPQLEAGVARTVAGDHVCRVLDVIERGESEPLLLILELAVHSLRWELQHDWGRTSLAQRIECGLAVSRGLAALHAARFVHRDLKPENVLRMPDGRLVLSDFGLTTRLADPGDAARTIGVGTLRYMAPEQRRGGATWASDLYALGLVLHEIFFGIPPRRDDATLTVIPGAAGAMTYAERQLRVVCVDCLAIEPRRRPRSAAAVVARLRRIQRWAQGNRARHGGYAAALGVAAAAVGIGYRAVHDSPRGETPRDAGAPGSDRWQALTPGPGEFDLELRASIPSHVSTCPSPAWRAMIPGLPPLAPESGLVGTLWRANLPLCLELQSHGVLLVYWGHRADEYTQGTWMISGRFVDLAVRARANPSSPEFHWTAEIQGRTMLARSADGESRTPIVLDQTAFDAGKPAGCSSVTLAEVDVSASPDRAGSPFDARYILSQIARPTLDACYRTYREAAVPHQEARWRLRHDEDGEIAQLALVYAERASIRPVKWFPDNVDPACPADAAARVGSNAPGYCENSFEGCVARALRSLKLGRTTLQPDRANRARFWYYGGTRGWSTDARVCQE